MTTNKNKLYEKAWNNWGCTLQLIMLIEECSELQKTITKIIRRKELMYKDSIFIKHFAEELADVEIMMEQVYCNYPNIKELKEKEKKAKLYLE